MTNLNPSVVAGSSISHFGNNLMIEINTWLREQNLEVATPQDANGVQKFRYVETTDENTGQPKYQITTYPMVVPDGVVQETTIYWKIIK